MLLSLVLGLVDPARAGDPSGCDPRGLGLPARRLAAESLERFDDTQWAWLMGEESELTVDDLPTGQRLRVYGSLDFARAAPELALTELTPAPTPPPSFARTVRTLGRRLVDALAPRAPAKVDKGTLHVKIRGEWLARTLRVDHAPRRPNDEPAPRVVLPTELVADLGQLRRRPHDHAPVVEMWAVLHPDRPGAWTAADSRALEKLARRVRALAPAAWLDVRAVTRASIAGRGEVYFVTRLAD